MSEEPTIDRDSTVPDEPERFRLWRMLLLHRDSVADLIERGNDAADFYRAVLDRLDELGNCERPPNDRKLRELGESLARQCVRLWLQDPNAPEAMMLAEGWLSRFRGERVNLADAHSKVMAEIRDGIGNTSNTHDNIATRIVRKQYQD